MNIEEAIDILKNSIADYIIGEYCEKCADNKICDDRNEECYYQQAIDIVVTAYEKEKEKREIAEENHKVLSLDLGKALKELGLYEDTIIADELALEINKRFVSKDKIKPIQIIDLDGKIHNVYKIEEE